MPSSQHRVVLLTAILVVAAQVALSRPPAIAAALFADGFESGNTSAWTRTQGPGTISVVAAAAKTGSFGLRMVNTGTQWGEIEKNFAAPLNQSTIAFATRITGFNGSVTVAQARDVSSSKVRWWLYYDAAAQGFWLFVFNGADASTDIFTGANTAPSGTWLNIEVRYDASASGSARLTIHGLSQPSWGMTGNLTTSAPVQALQLTNDAVTTIDFDDVVVNNVAVTPPPRATSVTPSTGSTTGGTAVTVNGTGFQTEVGRADG